MAEEWMGPDDRKEEDDVVLLNDPMFSDEDKIYITDLQEQLEEGYDNVGE